MRRREGFTLTELLVLMPVAALLGTLLFASLDDAKQKLQASQCLNNMRQWGLAIGMYCNDYNDYMPYEGTSVGIDAGPNLAAWFNVLPHYINQTPMKDLYDSSPPNIAVPGKKSIYICPSVTSMDPAIPTPPTTNTPYFSYAMNRVLTGAGGRVYKRTIAALPAQVILFSESENNQYPFTDGYFIGFSGTPPQNIPRHSGGDNFVFVDGHAQWYTQADYSRTKAESTNADVEWGTTKPKQRKVYWFPCGDPDLCNKT